MDDPDGANGAYSYSNNNKDRHGADVDNRSSMTTSASSEALLMQLQLPQDLAAAMQTALVNFDGLRVDAVIQAGFDVRRTYLDQQKYRNALHELALDYVSYSPAERPPKLHHKFIDILTVLLQNGLDINDGDFRHHTALHLVAASSGGHPEIIRVLLASGSRVNQPDAGQQTALHKAVVCGSREDVAALLEGGADPNFVDNMGHSALHVATKRKNNAEIIKLLVERGAKVNLNHPEWTKHSKGAAPLHTAARLGQVQNADALLRLGADANLVDGSGQTALHVAASHEITGRLCALLMSRGARPDARDRLLLETPLHKAVRANMVDNVRALLSHKLCDVRTADSYGNTALHKAALQPTTDAAVWNLLLLTGRAPLGAVNVDGLSVAKAAQQAKNLVGLALMRGFEQ